MVLGRSQPKAKFPDVPEIVKNTGNVGNGFNLIKKIFGEDKKHVYCYFVLVLDFVRICNIRSKKGGRKLINATVVLLLDRSESLETLKAAIRKKEVSNSLHAQIKERAPTVCQWLKRTTYYGGKIDNRVSSVIGNLKNNKVSAYF